MTVTGTVQTAGVVPVSPLTVKLYVVVVVGASMMLLLLRFGYVKVIHVIDGENVALVQLVYLILLIQ